MTVHVATEIVIDRPVEAGGRACPGFWRRSPTAMALSAARNVGTAVLEAG